MNLRSWNGFSTMSSHCTTQRKLVSPPRSDPSFEVHQLAPCLCLTLLKYWDSEQSETADTKMASAGWSCTLPRVSSGMRHLILGCPKSRWPTVSQVCTRWTPSLSMISCYIWRKTPSASEVLAFPEFQERSEGHQSHSCTSIQKWPTPTWNTTEMCTARAVHISAVAAGDYNHRSSQNLILSFA